jgi:hypothetical protein
MDLQKENGVKNISLVGLNKAAVLAALYNASKPQGMGFMRYNANPMTVEEAQALLNGGQTYFDYHQGRVLKTDLSGDELETYGYDRDNGPGAAAAALAQLTQTGSVNSAAIQAQHEKGKHESANFLKGHLSDGNSTREVEGISVFHMGVKDVVGVLKPAIDKALDPSSH